MAVPPGYTSLLIADQRRCQQWQHGLRVAGFESQVVDTAGIDQEKGDFHVCVAAEDASGARVFMTSVMRGEAELPHVSAVSATAVRALIGVFLTVGVAVSLFWLFG